MDFIITASSSRHGVIFPSGGVVVAEGADKTFTITPYAGYVVAGILVDGISVSGTSIDGVTTYAFTNVLAAHSISVTYNSVPFDPVQFRLDFPEFADTTKYPLSMVNFWAGLADTLLNIRRWGDKRPYGLALFVAHNLALAALNLATGVAGGTPGFGLGVTTGENAGPLSYSMDLHSFLEEGGGNYSLTIYGSQFLRLARIVGTGGIQV